MQKVKRREVSKTRKMQREKAAQEGVGARNRKMEGAEEEGRGGRGVRCWADRLSVGGGPRDRMQTC